MDAQVGSVMVERDMTSSGMVPTSDVVDGEYGLVDAQLGTAQPEFGGSNGEAAIPADEQLADDKGIMDNQSELNEQGAVTTADNATIGSIESVTPSGEKVLPPTRTANRSLAASKSAGSNPWYPQRPVRPSSTMRRGTKAPTPAAMNKVGVWNVPPETVVTFRR